MSKILYRDSDGIIITVQDNSHTYTAADFVGRSVIQREDWPPTPILGKDFKINTADPGGAYIQFDVYDWLIVGEFNDGNTYKVDLNRPANAPVLV